MIWFDYLTIGILLISSLIGLFRGLTHELFSFASWIIAAVAANHLGHRVAPYLPNAITNESVRLILAMVLVLIVVLILMMLIAKLCQEMLKATGLKSADNALGGLFGLARGALICILITIGVGLSEYPHSPEWQKSFMASTFVKLTKFTKPWLPDFVTQRLKF